MQDFLLELHTEELPPKLLPKFMDFLADNFSKELKTHNLNFTEIHKFGTPRRLAILVKDLEEKQADTDVNKKGPNTSANENAIKGFAKSCGVEVENLTIEATDKGEYYYFKNKQIGKYTKDLLAEISENAIKNIPITRPMRWANNDFSFIRPVRSLIMLFGSEIIPAEIMNLKSGNTTTGLRFTDNQITIDAASNYQQIMLEKAKIEVNFEKREQNIVSQIEKITSENNLQIIENKALLSEVCSLVEYPEAFIGTFEEKFLELPQEVIVLSMAEHQKYFAVQKDGKLFNQFVAIANSKSKDISVVIKGNEKVVRPRLEDGEFFWRTDKKTTLESKLEKLKTVVFMQGLGTMFDKVKRIENISGFVANITGANTELASRSGLLAKADLVSEMVGEFASLQGVMGGYYATFDGENNEVATAIKEHYNPKFAGDNLPSNAEGLSVAIADKIDTICGIFAIGQPPTGSKDPYALRRLALGLMRIFIEKNLDLDLKKLIDYSLDLHNKNDEKIASDIFEFMSERLKSYYKEQGVKTTSLIAASKYNSHLILDLHNRVMAIDEFSKTSDGKDLIAINKRIKGILSGAKYSEENTLNAKEELELQQSLELVKSENYKDFMQELLNLKTPLENFFDNLIVNDEDEKIKNARLTLLKKVADKFNTIGEI
jgi:glycyl-tRNA synthetase beta chain